MLHEWVRKLTTLGYIHIAKPMLFQLSPDSVHNQMINTGKIVQSTPVVNMLPRLWSHQDEKYLSQTLHGIYFKNPVGLSAGLDKNVEIPGLLHSVGFGFMTGGSVTYRVCEGNPRPWFYRLPNTRSLVVNAGLPNHGATAIAARIANAPVSWWKDFPLVVSIAKTNNKENASDEEAIKDYTSSLALLEKQGIVKAYEINISCPNTYGGEPFTTPKRLDQLLSAIDELALTRPVFIKMPINLPWEEFDALLQVIVAHNIQAVTIANLNKDRKSVKLKDELPDSVKGNLSGIPTKELGLELIRKTYQAYGDKLTIIGVGGIFSADDAYEKIRAGASMVELITGMIYTGPQLIGDINHDIVELLKKDGFSTIAEAVGADNKK